MLKKKTLIKELFILVLAIALNNVFMEIFFFEYLYFLIYISISGPDLAS